MDETYSLLGKQFGRWTVISLSSKRSSHNSVYWHCRCQCGVEREVMARSLRAGVSTSCGCYNRELMKGQKFALKHGKKRDAIYAVHQNMMARCYRPSDHHYPDYGGRGITVDSAWHDFEQFYADMGDPPKGLTLDRRDNDLGYSKSNCHWATKKQQSNNRRYNKLLTFNGITLNQKQWADKLGMDHKALHLRLKAGWSIEDALTRPVRKRNIAKLPSDNAAA